MKEIHVGQSEIHKEIMEKRLVFDFNEIIDKNITFDLLYQLRVLTGFDNEVVLNRALRMYLESVK